VKREFHENRHRDAHALLSDVNEFISLLSVFLDHFLVKFGTGNPHNYTVRQLELHDTRHTFGCVIKEFLSLFSTPIFGFCAKFGQDI